MNECAVSMADAGPSQKKRSFDPAFELKVVEFAEKNSNRGAGTHFGVDEKRVRVEKTKGTVGELAKKEEENGWRRSKGMVWIDALRATNLRVTRSSVQ